MVGSRRGLFCVLMSGLLGACAPQTQPGLLRAIPTPVNVKAQIEQLDMLAWETWQDSYEAVNGSREAQSKIPDSFTRQLQNVLSEVNKQLPPLTPNRFWWLADFKQLVSLDELSEVTAAPVVLYTFVATFEGEVTDWAAKIAVDLKHWKVLDWEVNLEPRGNNFSAKVAFPTISSREGISKTYLRYVTLQSLANTTFLNQPIYLAAFCEHPIESTFFDEQGLAYKWNAQQRTFDSVALRPDEVLCPFKKEPPWTPASGMTEEELIQELSIRIPGYGGRYYDSEGFMTVAVVSTQPLGDIEKENAKGTLVYLFGEDILYRQKESGPPEMELRFKHVHYTLLELLAWQKDMRFPPFNPPFSITGGGIDEIHNCVAIWVSDVSNKEASKELLESLKMQGIPEDAICPLEEMNLESRSGE